MEYSKGWSPATAEDIEVFKHQMRLRKFDASMIIAVGHRCKYGYPQVAVSYSLSANSEPFPTVFWLTCPYLEKKCGSLESCHKIPELEEILKALPEETERMHKQYAALRMSLIKNEDFAQASEKVKKVLSDTGVGGINFAAAPFAVKCLHLQTAAWLGMGTHPASQWLRDNIGNLDCEEEVCS